MGAKCANIGGQSVRRGDVRRDVTADPWPRGPLDPTKVGASLFALVLKVSHFPRPLGNGLSRRGRFLIKMRPMRPPRVCPKKTSACPSVAL